MSFVFSARVMEEDEEDGWGNLRQVYFLGKV
jgi:hypothetical protein